MKRWLAAVAAAAMLAGCSERANRVDLGVDVYLHPQSGTADDLILQAAIRKKLAEDLPANSGNVYVRVVERNVFLSGTVKSQDVKALAVKAAETVDVRIDGNPIKPASVKGDSITTP
jgi:osmotically-inducible protein OsmY